MSSSSSPQIPILRWAILILLGAFLWAAVSGQFAGILPILSPGLTEANSALAAGDVKKATALFNAEIRRSPANPAVYELISHICIANKHSEIAVQLLEGALYPNRDLPRPERARFYGALAEAYSFKEPKPQYQTIFAAQRAAELDPSSPTNLNTFGYTLADNNVDLDTAVARLTQALELLKKQDDGVENRLLVCMTEDSYGWALYQQGKYDLAATALYQAINDYPEEITESATRAENLKLVYYHLGAAYRQQHKPEQARRALQTALSLDKGCKEAQDELNALNQEFPLPAPKAEKLPVQKGSPSAPARALPGNSPGNPVPTKATAPGSKA